MTSDKYDDYERDTTETSESDLKNLIRQTDSNNQDSATGVTEEVSESRLRQESVRFATDESITQSPVLKYVVAAAVIIVVFLIGFLPANIIGNSTESTLKKEISDIKQQQAKANQDSTNCFNELSGCVQDVNAITSHVSAVGMAPRDHHVEAKRKKKEAAEEEVSTVLNMILDALKQSNNPRKISKDQWKELKQNLSEYSKLKTAVMEAAEEYKAARAGTVKNVVNPADPKVMERNKNRASFLAKSSDR